MRYLITGGAGFIGSHLAERLIADGAYVAVLDDMSTGSPDNLSAIAANPKLSVTVGDILDAGLVDRMAADCDLIIHLAAAVGVRLIMEEPKRSLLTNVTGTEHVLESADKHKKRVLIASTSEVYGKATKLPFSEEDDLVMGATANHRWSYACAKMLDEHLTLAYVRGSGLDGVIVRFFNTTGPRQTGRYGMVLPSFVDCALKGAPIMVHGSGEQSRSFGHVADVVEAVVRLSATAEAKGEVFNVGNDEEVTILGLAEKIREMTGSSSEIRKIPYTDVYPEGFEDMQRRRPSVKKLEKFTGFRPRLSLERIIADVIAEKRKA
ncbi:MAG: NAD-dependent epimerase/dehydratase family protein [Parvularculaceae bacterium]